MTMTTAYATTWVETEPLSLRELARAVGADDRWVMQLVAVEILHVDAPEQAPHHWRFRSTDLARARAARQLERDFGANLDTAALVLALQAELHRARALLLAHGLGPATGEER